MTNSFTDIKNADVVLLLGSNTAENHPLAMKHVQKAMDNGGTLINVDPRFNRSSAKADIHAFMRSGTDIAFIGGMIKYAIDHKLYNEKYVKECTNALLRLDPGFKTCAETTIGVFSDFKTGAYNDTLAAELDASYGIKDDNQKYVRSTWAYDVPLAPTVAANLNETACVFQKLKKQFDGYTIANVCSITGTDPVVYEQICKTYCGTYPDTKSATILYAMGTTQHTVGTQNIRAYSILQLLLGNIGVAGGGINALRGQDNVQGATDQAVLHDVLPGYLKVPAPIQTSLGLYKDAYYKAGAMVQPAGMQTSLHWWQNGTKYITSLLKAWWPTIDHETSYTYLSRKIANYSILSMFDDMYHDKIVGAIFDGENPAVSDPASEHVREALGHLDWLVCIDPYEQETAAFWKRPGVNPADIGTTVYLLPTAVALEKYGSRSNSSRWVQWHWKGGKSPGENLLPDYGARSDMDILTQLGDELKNGTIDSGNIIADDQIQNLSWPCLKYDPLHPVTDDALAELIAKEMHGYNGTNVANSFNPGTLVSNFVGLQSNGSTACGNWLHSGMFASAPDSFESGTLGLSGTVNRAKRRYSTDVGQLGWGVTAGVGDYKNIGLYSYWSWCWPINRRIVYNRASAILSTGVPLAPKKYVMKWDATASTWRGDQWDGGAAPSGALPFIMNNDGLGHLFGGWNMAEGPFPWHYEPAESPITYPSWLGTYRMNPAVHLYAGSVFASHTDLTYNIFATSYRVTEHWHTGAMTRNLPRANELMPEPFVEMSVELAADKGIANGDTVRVTSARGSIEVKACVTKRFKPFWVAGKTVHQIGVIWHWGYMGLSTGDSGNILTPFIGDANTRIPESKCFMVKIEKV
jgi:formate dehydrogenase-N alpha subunit